MSENKYVTTFRGIKHEYLYYRINNTLHNKVYGCGLAAIINGLWTYYEGEKIENLQK